jgi:uncharacterized protein YodC (DUF2158 family)
MQQIFKPGDVVQLKSGGPKMTVTQAEDDVVGTPTVWVAWFDQKGEPKEGAYPETAVQSVE